MPLAQPHWGWAPELPAPRPGHYRAAMAPPPSITHPRRRSRAAGAATGRADRVVPDPVATDPAGLVRADRVGQVGRDRTDLVDPDRME